MGKSKVHSHKPMTKKSKLKTESSSLGSKNLHENFELQDQEERIKGVFAALESCFVKNKSLTDCLGTLEKQLDIKENTESVKKESSSEKKELNGKKAKRNTTRSNMPSVHTKKRKTHPIKEPFDEFPYFPERIQPSRRAKETKSALKDEAFEFEIPTAADIDEDNMSTKDSSTVKPVKKHTRRRSRDEDGPWTARTSSVSPKSKIVNEESHSQEHKHKLRRRRNSAEEASAAMATTTTTATSESTPAETTTPANHPLDDTLTPTAECNEVHAVPTNSSSNNRSSLIQCEEQLPPSPHVKLMSPESSPMFRATSPLFTSSSFTKSGQWSLFGTDDSLSSSLSSSTLPSLSSSLTSLPLELSADTELQMAATTKEGRCEDFIERVPTFINTNDLPELELGLDINNELMDCMELQSTTAYQPTCSFTHSEFAELRQSLAAPEQQTQELLSWYNSLWS